MIMIILMMIIIKKHLKWLIFCILLSILFVLIIKYQQINVFIVMYLFYRLHQWFSSQDIFSAFSPAQNIFARKKILIIEWETWACASWNLLANFSPQKKHNARGGSEHVEVIPDWVPPTSSASDLNSLCSRVWRRAINFFLLPIHFW